MKPYLDSFPFWILASSGSSSESALRLFPLWWSGRVLADCRPQSKFLDVDAFGSARWDLECNWSGLGLRRRVRRNATQASTRWRNMAWCFWTVAWMMAWMVALRVSSRRPTCTSAGSGGATLVRYQNIKSSTPPTASSRSRWLICLLLLLLRYCYSLCYPCFALWMNRWEPTEQVNTRSIYQCISVSVYQLLSHPNLFLIYQLTQQNSSQDQ